MPRGLGLGVRGAAVVSAIRRMTKLAPSLFVVVVDVDGVVAIPFPITRRISKIIVPRIRAITA